MKKYDDRNISRHMEKSQRSSSTHEREQTNQEGLQAYITSAICGKYLKR